MPDLFFADTVYVRPDGTEESAEEVLRAVADDLLAKGLVKDGFLSNLLAREATYPTGMDMSVVDPSMPSFAVPHTECEFVNTTRIVPVRLGRPIAWRSMLDPTQEVVVSYLFLILNQSPEGQTNILARIMDFAAEEGAEGMWELLGLEDPAAVAAYLNERL